MPEDLKSLVKNPLGIIALFIALIYGFAALLLGVSASQLLPEERQPLIWFIVLFPMVVLGTFYILVTRHHGKLYAPKDYQNDDSFLRTLTDKQREDKLEEEISSVTLEESSPSIHDNNVQFSRSTSNVSEKPLISSLMDFKERYIEAEKLAIAKIEIERGLVFRKQVAFGGERAAAFDGVAIQSDAVTAIEVKLLRKSLVPPSSIREILYRAVLASNFTKTKFSSAQFKLIIVLVLEEESRPLEEVKRVTSKIVEEAPFPVEICVFNLTDLKTELNSGSHQKDSIV